VFKLLVDFAEDQGADLGAWLDAGEITQIEYDILKGGEFQ
jgi:hypothetical protein